MDTQFIDLYNEFMTLVEKGDEQGARDFLVNNLQKFPEELQDKITFAFFEEAVNNKAEEIKNVAEVQEQGLDAMSKIDKIKKVLEEKKKIEDLKANLTK